VLARSTLLDRAAVAGAVLQQLDAQAAAVLGDGAAVVAAGQVDDGTIVVAANGMDRLLRRLS
jgi:hypothetical protein